MRLPRPIETPRQPALAPTRLSLALLPLLGTALLASPPLSAQQVYKWKDAAGVTHFTAEPPPQGQHYEAREVDHHQAAPQAQEASATDAGDAGGGRRAAEDPACATARGNLALLSGSTPVSVDSNGDGKPDKPLSAAERESQRKLAEATIAVKCRGAVASAQPPEPEER